MQFFAYPNGEIWLFPDFETAIIARVMFGVFLVTTRIAD